MLKYINICGLILVVITSESSANGIKHTNILGGAEQHASFSFVRPGLTQTSFAFNGPSSHQTFASNVGNTQLTQKVLPNVAHALAYRNPGLGYFSNGPISTASAYPGEISAQSVLPTSYQFTRNPAVISYLQQGQQFPTQVDNQFAPANYPAHLLRLMALRQLQPHQVPEEIQLQQEQPAQNLLGVAYSSAPSVAHVKVSGTGYEFNF